MVFVFTHRLHYFYSLDFLAKNAMTFSAVSVVSGQTVGNLGHYAVVNHFKYMHGAPLAWSLNGTVVISILNGGQ